MARWCLALPGINQAGEPAELEQRLRQEFPNAIAGAPVRVDDQYVVPVFADWAHAFRNEMEQEGPLGFLVAELEQTEQLGAV